MKIKRLRHTGYQCLGNLMEVTAVRAEVQKSWATEYLLALSLKFTLCHPCGV